MRIDWMWSIISDILSVDEGAGLTLGKIGQPAQNPGHAQENTVLHKLREQDVTWLT